VASSETAERQLGGVGTKVLFENEYVRVWEMDLAPGESSDVHRHDHDYILVILDGDRIAAIPEPDTGGTHKEYFEAEVNAPMIVQLAKGGIETAKNVGQKRYYELLIELLK
jgi:predicted metal-dependent enzyme (double-stranded beta helix superfamily)